MWLNGKVSFCRLGNRERLSSLKEGPIFPQDCNMLYACMISSLHATSSEPSSPSMPCPAPLSLNLPACFSPPTPPTETGQAIVHLGVTMVTQTHVFCDASITYSYTNKSINNAVLIIRRPGLNIHVFRDLFVHSDSSRAFKTTILDTAFPIRTMTPRWRWRTYRHRKQKS